MSRNGGQVSYRVNVRLDQQVPTGYFAEHLVLDTNDAQGKHIFVPVAGKVEPEISLHPGTSLFLDQVEWGQKVTKQLVIQGRQPFQVSQVICDGQGFTASPSAAKARGMST